MTNILITGGTGLLGVALQNSAPTGVQGYATCTPTRSLPLPLPFTILPTDLNNYVEMKEIFQKSQPEVVIHTAAIGSVDFAEKNREITHKVNYEGTKLIINLCKEFNARLIFISSNAVFDGKNPFYSETAPVNPINYYGQIKAGAEQLIQHSGLNFAIVRTIMLYGWQYPGGRDNPVTWWVRSLEENKPIKVVDNIYSKPLPAYSCAEVIWAVLNQNHSGIYHAAGRDHVTLYEFALSTAQVFELNQNLIEPVPDSYFSEIAIRPKDTSFDTTKMETELGIQPVSIIEGLEKMKAERFS